jgi:hypothetical protein
MKIRSLSLFFVSLLSFLTTYTSVAQTDSLHLSIGKSNLNKTLWTQPYRYQDKNLKTLSVQIFIEKNTDKAESIDFNLFSLIDESRKLRIRPVAIYLAKPDKNIYLKSKSVNKNYNAFLTNSIDEYLNFEAKTYKTNFFGIKKKSVKPTVKNLKRLDIKTKKSNYFIDFPVYENFLYGKIFYKDKPIGYTAIKEK